IEYARTLGLTADDGSIEGMSAIPFLVDFGDGTPPLARAIYQVTPEGYASFGGDMPVGATLAIGSLDYNDVIESALTTTKSALETGKENGMLLFPCLSRNLALGGDVTAELKKIHDTLGGRVPHMAAYSGGEICPVYGPDGTPVNRFHNFTFIACVF
ncbi:FIST C-terminal domain-containing protein, partial [Oscillospiraceae bacterium OttesenSCG-928-G22]|nr:FIST C-terminal domain-containing protein [Oscillospiraceae bacterium OttesenSCG-928-G22]